MLSKTGNLADAWEDRRSRGSDWLKDDLERIWERWLKRRRDLPSFSPILLDATNYLHSILLQYAILLSQLLSYWPWCAHLRHRHYHSPSQAILGGGENGLPYESTGDSCTS